MIKDGTIVWWSQTGESFDQGVYGTTGTFCYANLGGRYVPGAFPSGEPDLFNGPCH